MSLVSPRSGREGATAGQIAGDELDAPVAAGRIAWRNAKPHIWLGHSAVRLDANEI
jgi:hypothetical protein